MVRYKGLKTLEILQWAHKYNRWISQQILPYCLSPLLELGSGTGNITQYLTQFQTVYASDIDTGLLLLLKKKFRHKKNIRVIRFDAEKKVTARFKSAFSSVVSVNVFEHLEDDQKAIKNVHYVLKKNGRLILLVPAKQFALTRLDRELGHFRRYEKKQLEITLKKEGFVLEKLYFFNFLGLLSWIVRDRIERKRTGLKRYQIFVFDNIVPFLALVEKFIKPPLGISLVAIARKSTKR